jgi:hypothetical protein
MVALTSAAINSWGENTFLSHNPRAIAVAILPAPIKPSVFMINHHDLKLFGYRNQFWNQCLRFREGKMEDNPITCNRTWKL